MSFENCLPWGWNDLLESFYVEHCSASRSVLVEPARVISDSHQIYGVFLPRLGVEFRARVSGKFAHATAAREDFPAVGDWVCVEGMADGDKRITHVLPRKSCLKRKAAGDRAELQVFAAQIDEVWVVTSCNQDLSPERLERALVLASESAARVRILISKSDLAEPGQLAPIIQDLEDRLVGIPVQSFSTKTGQGVAELKALLKPAETYIVIGSSGVGKSTLLNELLGGEVLRVQESRTQDDKGRHTTTGRSLHRLPSGAMLIDTPGTRELQLFASPEALEESFSDISDLALGCKFSDCRHETESHCAVKRALETGVLSEERWQNYLKLGREMAFQQRRKDKGVQSVDKKHWAKMSRDAALRARIKGRS
ncbi:MAG: ribosome small subunit-dependent GTPase A [Bdellovibrionota bacterium]